MTLIDLDDLRPLAEEPERDPSLPPHSASAEEAVLGSVLKQPSCLARLTLAPEDFYDLRYGAIYTVMQHLHRKGEPVDYMTISEELKRTGFESVVALLPTVNLAVGTAAHVESYAATVAFHAHSRRLISAGHTIAEVGFNHRLTSEEKHAKALALITGAQPTRRAKRLYSPEERADAYLDAQERGDVAGIGWGVEALDLVLGELRVGTLNLISARPGVGKSHLAQQIAIDASDRHGPVLYASTEMDVVRLTEREVFIRSGEPRVRVETGQSGARRAAGDDAVRSKALGRIGDGGRLWVTYGTLAISDVRADAQEIMARTNKPLALVVLDYLQQFRSTEPKGTRRNEVVAALSLEAQRLAVELRCPVLAPVQLNRIGAGLLPTLAELAESDGLGRDADTVIGLLRPGLEPETDEDKRMRPSDAKVLVMKHRDEGEMRAKQVTLAFRRGRYVSGGRD